MVTPHSERIVMALVMVVWVLFGAMYISSELQNVGDLRHLFGQDKFADEEARLAQPISGNEILQYINTSPHMFKQDSGDLAKLKRELQNVGDNSYLASRRVN